MVPPRLSNGNQLMAPNRGAIRFIDRKYNSQTAAVAYAIPGILGKLMDNLFLGRAVESSSTSLERFHDYALKAKSS